MADYASAKQNKGLPKGSPFLLWAVVYCWYLFNIMKPTTGLLGVNFPVLARSKLAWFLSFEHKPEAGFLFYRLRNVTSPGYCFRNSKLF